jgi:hypothetical protein
MEIRSSFQSSSFNAAKLAFGKKKKNRESEIIEINQH